MFDYRVVHTCGYGMVDSFNEEYECGEPAPYEVWWGDSSMFVCNKHFDFIQAIEG